MTAAPAPIAVMRDSPAGWARWPAIVATAVVAAGCASTPATMVLEVESLDTSRVWPAQRSDEMSRYRMVGQLVGEGNFVDTGRFAKSPLGGALRWLVGLNEVRDEPNVLRRPQGGAVDRQGRVYVTDVSRKALFVFDPVAGRLSIWDRANREQRFVAPIGVVAGPGGSVLVADAELKRVFRLRADGEPLGEFGTGLLQRPTGLARDPVRGRVFVADTRAHDIKVFDDGGQLVDTIGGPGSAAGELSHPTYLAWANDRLYVTDTMNARVQVFDERGHPVLQFGKRGLYVGNLVLPKGIAVDDEGTIYVVEGFHDHVLMFDRDGRFLMSIGGTGKAGGQFYLPAGVWTDRDNRIYVADMFNGRVSIFQFLGGDQ